MEKRPGPTGIAMQALNQSLRAAIDARLLSQTIQSLNQRTVNLQQALGVMQAAEQSRLAAEQEAQRVAAEQARIQAEAKPAGPSSRAGSACSTGRSRAGTTAEQARDWPAEAAAQHVAAEQARLEAEAEQRTGS